MYIDGFNYELTQEQLDVLSFYMDDLREELVYKLSPCDPSVFLQEYLNREPSFKVIVKDILKVTDY